MTLPLSISTNKTYRQKGDRARPPLCAFTSRINWILKNWNTFENNNVKKIYFIASVINAIKAQPLWYGLPNSHIVVTECTGSLYLEHVRVTLVRTCCHVCNKYLRFQPSVWRPALNEKSDPLICYTVITLKLLMWGILCI